MATPLHYIPQFNKAGYSNLQNNPAFSNALISKPCHKKDAAAREVKDGLQTKNYGLYPYQRQYNKVIILYPDKLLEDFHQNKGGESLYVEHGRILMIDEVVAENIGTLNPRYTDGAREIYKKRCIEQEANPTIRRVHKLTLNKNKLGEISKSGIRDYELTYAMTERKPSQLNKQSASLPEITAVNESDPTPNLNYTVEVEEVQCDGELQETANKWLSKWVEGVPLCNPYPPHLANAEFKLHTNKVLVIQSTPVFSLMRHLHVSPKVEVKVQHLVVSDFEDKATASKCRVQVQYTDGYPREKNSSEPLERQDGLTRLAEIYYVKKSDKLILKSSEGVGLKGLLKIGKLEYLCFEPAHDAEKYVTETEEIRGKIVLKLFFDEPVG